MLRLATRCDSPQIWQWRNDETTRTMSFDSKYVSWPIHEKWFEDALAHSHRKLYIFENDGHPAAVVRLDLCAPHVAEVSINVAPDCRGQGVGTAALRQLADTARELGLNRLVAKIKPTNIGSLRSFTHAGFRQTSEEEPEDVPVVLELDLKPVSSPTPDETQHGK